LDARLVPQDKGYTVYIPKLPGVVSEGDDAASALKNITEALALAIETYEQEDMPIPWADPEPAKPGEEDFRIVVTNA
jgi:predicted RNase H-like HicB family nuclease